MTLDIDALERAAKDAETESPLFQAQNDLPPPPKNLFRDRPTGGYRSVTPPPMEDTAGGKKPSTPPPSGRGRPASTPPRRPSSPPASPASRAAQAAVKPPVTGSTPDPGATAPSGEGRYAPARPAAIFGRSQSRPQMPSSLFGEDLISDKSLDEVILSYLAEDLEPTEKKK